MLLPGARRRRSGKRASGDEREDETRSRLPTTAKRSHRSTPSVLAMPNEALYATAEIWQVMSGIGSIRAVAAEATIASVRARFRTNRAVTCGVLLRVLQHTARTLTDSSAGPRQSSSTNTKCRRCSCSRSGIPRYPARAHPLRRNRHPWSRSGATDTARRSTARCPR